jgi:tyrosyl-DNA phosphodiesterase-1
MFARGQEAADRKFALQLQAEEDGQLAQRLAQRLAADDARPSKRARAGAGAGAGAARSVLPPSGRTGVGFHLFRAKGAPPEHNVDTVTFADLVPPADDASGAPRFAVWSNVVTDVNTLVVLCPSLLAMPKCFFLCCAAAAAQVQFDTGGSKQQFEAFAPLMDIGKDENTHGVHHAKFVLAAYARCLAVSVHSCNGVEVDGTPLTEALWTQSFPLKAPAAGGASSPFEDELVSYLLATGWRGGAVGDKQVTAQTLREFDFSAAKAALVATVPGMHSGENMQRYGHMRVRKLLEAERFPARFVGSPLAVQVSAVASVNPAWLDEIFESFGAGCADDTAATKLGVPVVDVSVQPSPPPRLYFIWPTMEEVRTAMHGWGTGGALPASARVLDERNAGARAMQVRRARWRGGADAEGRGGFPAHAKTFCRFHATDGSIAYLMLGSHCFSDYAWGNVVLKKTAREALRCGHYELSVMLLPSLMAAAGGDEAAGSPRFVTTAHRGGTAAGLDGATLALRLPYALPPVPYAPGDAPWSIQKAPRDEPDSYGRTLEDMHMGMVPQEDRGGGGAGGAARSKAPVEVIELD